MVEVNPHYISQLSTGATIGQIEDDVDFPHTGLFKSLMQGVSGNFVVKNNTNDFDITQSASDPVVSVAVGSYLDNGELKTTSGVATFNAAAFTFTTNKAYYLLVVNSSGTVALRVPTVANRVANHSAGDTIIAMIEIADDTSAGSRKVQFFTSSKTDNHLSIARDNSGAYTEMGKITSDTDSIDITTTNSNADINLTPHGTGDVKLGTLAVDGDQTVGSGQDGYVLTYTHSNAKAALAVLPTSGLANVVEDTSPQLGGNLDMQTNSIVTTSNRDINLTPNGTGKVNVSGDLKASGVQYQQFMDLTDDLATGYHTIALIEGATGGSASGTGSQSQRGIGTFLIRNTDSSRHQTISLTASHLFGGANGNGISVEHSSYYSTLGINAVRLKENSTYDGAVLQINIADATNDIEVYLKNNFQESGWVLIQAVADASDPSTGSLGLGFNNAYSTFAATATTSITDIAQLGQRIQGPLAVGSIRTVDGIEINGDLDHDGSNVGFYGVAPTTRGAVANLGSSTIASRPPDDPTLAAGFEPSNAAYLQTLEDEIGFLRTKVDLLIDKLQLTGLIS